MIDFSKYQQINAVNVTNSSKFQECIGIENAVYQKCGKKCVLGCRFIPNISDLAVTLNDCEAAECIEGCFCKDGFVRLHDKCILPKECPVRSNKSIQLSTEMPKRIIKPMCGGSNGCRPTPKPCKHCKIKILNDFCCCASLK